MLQVKRITHYFVNNFTTLCFYFSDYIINSDTNGRKLRVGGGYIAKFYSTTGTNIIFVRKKIV